MKKGNTLYTTVTISDFKDTGYINELIKHNIGLELAILTHLSGNINTDLENLKKEIIDFCHSCSGPDTYETKYGKIKATNIINQNNERRLLCNIKCYTNNIIILGG